MRLQRLLVLAWCAAALPGNAQLIRCSEDGRIVYRNSACADAPQGSAAAQVSRPAAEVRLLDGALRLALPVGFTRLSSEEMAIKFPRSNRPPFAAFADERRNATLAFSLSRREKPFTEDQLPAFLAAMEELFPRMMPGLVWHRREIVSVGERRWARLQLSAHALDTDVRNDMYFTPLRGAILGVNLTATISAWPKAEPALAQAFRTIRID